jgi:hypothetical protein
VQQSRREERREKKKECETHTQLSFERENEGLLFLEALKGNSGGHQK